MNWGNDIMYEYIDKIKSPKDIKLLSEKELEKLCEEIREYLVNTVSKTGGHLASNLGIVELTVALHRVLDAPYDKIVWDVGHQSYVHKILTGRAENLNSLRSFNGLSGFCSPVESEYDTSFTGHASASLSTALGMVQAGILSGEKYNVATVIGDGSFTGGLAYEALNNIGHLKSKMLIILNDNEMSIEQNVGAFSSFLAKARTNQKYTSSKRKLQNAVKKLSGGEAILKVLRKIKNRIKSLVAPNILFEQLGITYLGPVDGHNIRDMEELFKRAIQLNEPVLVHVITKKGKGYIPAEKEPQKYHGVSPFEKEKGVKSESEKNYASVFGEKICELAEKNEKVVVVSPAMVSGSGLSEFKKSFPKRLYDVGIAEGHAVTFSGGLSKGGAVPVAVIYSTFLQRSYDNIIHDAAIGNDHVVLAVDRAGIVPYDGPTHQGIFDITYLTSIPNMTVLSPSSYSELCKMLDYAVMVHDGPIAIRDPKGQEKIAIDNGKFELKKAAIVKEGKDITIAAEGQNVSNAIIAAQILEKRGISAEVIDIRTIKPIDFDAVFNSALKSGRLFTIESNLKRGGMGEQLAAEAVARSLNFDIQIRAIEDEFVPHGELDKLNEKYGFIPEQIAEDIERMLEK